MKKWSKGNNNAYAIKIQSTKWSVGTAVARYMTWIETWQEDQENH